MKSSYLPIFCPPGAPDGPSLTFVGQRDGDELLDGKLLADGVQVGSVRNGIAIFVDPDVSPPAPLEQMRKRWVPHNWRNETEQAAAPPRKDLCDGLASLASKGGIILEVAAGPGGGNLAPVLHRCPDAAIIVNDISADVLQAWKDFLAEQNTGRNVCFAAFDARKMPIRTAALDAISNSGGFGNIREGPKSVHEACRVLKPGGRIFSLELVLEGDGLTKLPQEFQDVLSDEVIARGMAPVLESQGLTIEFHRIAGGRDLNPEQDELAIKAAKYGVTLHVHFEHLIARKPVA